MKMFLSIIFTLVTLNNASALIIRGEESKNHFIHVKQIENTEKYYFLECTGRNSNLKCESFFSVPQYFSKEDILEMVDEKRTDRNISIAADIAIILVSLPFNAYRLGYTAGRAYYGSLGYSLEGVGTASGVVSVATITPAGTSSLFIFDVLDPRTHGDIASALEASVSANSYDANTRDYEGINYRNTTIYSSDSDVPSKHIILEEDPVVKVNNLSTDQIVKSIKAMIKQDLIKKSHTEYEMITGEEHPVQRLLNKDFKSL